jgi:hypothetical protein
MKHLVPCPECSRHVRVSETECPFCALPLDLAGTPEPQLPRGRLSRAATLAFGATLVSASALAACSSDSDTGNGNGGATSSAGSAGKAGAASAGAGGGGTVGPVYGAPAGGSFGAGGALYGAAGADNGDAGRGGGGAVPLYGAAP